MSDFELDLNENNGKPAPRRGDPSLSRRARPRGMVQQLTTVLMRPVLFFQTLAPASDSRQWVLAALLIVALVGVAHVRYVALGSAGGSPVTGAPIDMGGGDFGGGGGDFGGVPPGFDPSGGGGGVTGGAASSITDDLTLALLAGADIVLGWLILTTLLLIVPMASGRAPRAGLALQVAVWSSVPLGLMAVLQWVYYASGGQAGQAGVSGLLPNFEFYTGAGPFMQAVLLVLAGKLTVFWVWSLMLVAYGARHTLHGPVWIVPVVLVMWIAAQVLLPVASGAVKVPEAAPIDMGGFPSDGGMGGDMGGFPSDGGDIDEETGGESLRPLDAPVVSPPVVVP
jgi:hypothetical protein